MKEYRTFLIKALLIIILLSQITPLCKISWSYPLRLKNCSVCYKSAFVLQICSSMQKYRKSCLKFSKVSISFKLLLCKVLWSSFDERFVQYAANCPSMLQICCKCSSMTFFSWCKLIPHSFEVNWVLPDKIQVI